MIRRMAGALFVVALCVLLADAAAAEAPAGPRLAFLRYVTHKTEALTVNANGGQLRQISGVQEQPSWSADGSELAFAKTSSRRGHGRIDIYLADADGSGSHRILGTRGGFDPVLSPDGHTLAFARERTHRLKRGWFCCSRATVWLLDLNDHLERRLTPWQIELFELPASFTPDGSTLAVEREEPMGAETRYTVLALHLAGDHPTVLAEDATEPVYSPDGTRLALITTGREEEAAGGLEVLPTHLAVANADGSGLMKLTQAEAEQWGPSWDASGQRLAYIQYAANGTYDSYFGDGDSIMEVNPDGTCRTKVLSYPKAILSGVTWQPGPGREAGPIAC